MGSFAVTCVLSGLSIYTQKAVYIPLQPAKYTLLNKRNEVGFEVTNNYVTNEGAFGMFVPKYLPVFGEYDTYGRLENIEGGGLSAISLPALEKVFNFDVAEYGCFVDRKMWNWAVGFDRISNSVYNNYAVAKHIELFAEKLGFVHERNLDGEVRYNKIFYHKDSPYIKLYSDGTWIQTIKGESFYDFDELTKYYLKNGVVLPDMGFLKELSAMEIVIKQNIINRRKANLFNSPLYSLHQSEYYTRDLEQLYDNYETVDINVLAKAFADLIHFSHVMYKCNRMFIPQLSGPQTGDYNILLEMYAKASSICNEVIEMYRDDYEEGDN